MSSTPTIAFYAAHPFEFLHFEPLRKHLRGAGYLVGDPDTARRRQAIQAMNARGIPCADMATADVARYGACVVRHDVHGAMLFPSDTIMIRLMDRCTNPNNATYGPANAFYDAILTCGPWATRHLMPYAPCVEVGNPTLDTAFNDDRPGDGVTTDKPRVLYFAPTSGTPAGDPTPRDPYRPQLTELSRRCDVVIKLGSETVRSTRERMDAYAEVAAIRILAPDEDAMPCMRSSSVVVAPFSDPVFEALALRIPVVLCGGEAQARLARGECLLSLDGCEDRRLYRELGVHNLDPERLVEHVFEAVHAEPVDDAFVRIFYDPGHLDGRAGRRAADAIRAIVSDPPARTNTQEQARRSFYGAGLPQQGAARHALEIGRADLLPNVVAARRASRADRTIFPVGSLPAGQAYRALRVLMDTSEPLRIGRAQIVSEVLSAVSSPPRWLWRALGRSISVGERRSPASPSASSNADGTGVAPDRWLAAQRYESSWWKDWLTRHPDRNDDEWLQYVAKRFRITSTDVFEGAVVVDVGGGPIGLLTKLQAARRIVVDPLGLPAVDETIERMAAPGEAIPLRDAMADAVLLYNVLQHVRSPRDVLNECTRIVRSGGSLYILEQLYLPTNPGHPHTLTEALFDRWLLEGPLVLERWEIDRGRSFDDGGRSRDARHAILNIRATRR